MTESLSPPPLLPSPAAPDDPGVGAVVARAERLVHEVLDELRAGPLGRGGRVGTEQKADGSPVTAVDVEVNERIVAAVEASFPAHGVVSEELDAVARGEAWQWVVDPVDGTSNFAAGLPHWCVSIALCHGGVPVLGIIDAPDLDTRWVGTRGGACHRNGAPVRVRAIERVDDPATSHLPLFTSLGFLRRVARPAGVRLNPRVFGAAALDGALVADGVGVAAALTGPRVWDVAASAVLVEAAGGAVVRLGDPVFPLRSGLDHTDVRVPSVFGPSRAAVDDLVTRLTPDGGSLA